MEMRNIAALLLGVISVNFAYADQHSDKYRAQKEMTAIIAEISSSIVQSSELDARVKNALHENELRFAHIG